MDASDMAKKIIRIFTADVRKKLTFGATSNTTVGGAEMAGSDRRQNPSRFPLCPLFKSRHFGLRQARGRFGRFSDRPDRAHRDEPLRPTEEGVQDKTIEHDNEMTTTTTMIVLKTKVRVDDDDDEVDDDNDEVNDDKDEVDNYNEDHCCHRDHHHCHCHQIPNLFELVIPTRYHT